jgi:hypothetical protein
MSFKFVSITGVFLLYSMNIFLLNGNKSFNFFFLSMLFHQNLLQFLNLGLKCHFTISFSFNSLSKMRNTLIKQFACLICNEKILQNLIYLKVLNCIFFFDLWNILIEQSYLSSYFIVLHIHNYIILLIIDKFLFLI